MNEDTCPLCPPNKRPNAETLAAMAELENGGGSRCSTIDELMALLNADDGEEAP
jgi:hypothetical protein